jgi:hypothetical protein
MNRFLKATEVDNFREYLILFVTAFRLLIMWPLVASETFRDRTKGFQNPFKPMGFELHQRRLSGLIQANH